MYNIRLQPGEKIIGYCESVYDCSASFDSDITGELFMTNKKLIFVESEEIRMGSLFSNPFRNKASKEKQKTEYISLKSILLTNGVTQVFPYNDYEKVH